MFFAGCSTNPAKKDNSGQFDELSIRSMAVMQAVVDGDYPAFACNAGEMVNDCDADNFVRSRENLILEFGNICSGRLLGELQTPLLSNRIYAISFEKNGSDGKKIRHEQLLQLIFSKEKGDCRLLGMRFI